MNYLRITFAVLIVLIGCNSVSINNDLQQDSSVEGKITLSDSLNPISERDPKIWSNDSEYFYFDSVVVGKDMLKLKTTCLNRSTSEAEDKHFDPIVLMQEFSFYNNNVLVKVEQLPIEKVNVLKLNGQKVQIPDNVITEIGTVGDSGKFLFTIQGWGGCNTCSESFGLFDRDGNLKYFYCGSRFSKNPVQIGSDSIAMTEAGLAVERYENHEYNSIQVYPKK